MQFALFLSFFAMINAQKISFQLGDMNGDISGERGDIGEETTILNNLIDERLWNADPDRPFFSSWGSSAVITS